MGIITWSIIMSDTLNATERQNLGLIADDDGDIVDVVKLYDWTVGNIWARKNVPSVTLIEYQQTSQSIIQSIKYWLTQGRQLGEQLGGTTWNIFSNSDSGIVNNLTNIAALSPSSEPYKGLYMAKKTGNVYRFPYLNSYHHNITNSWGDNKGFIGELVEEFTLKTARRLYPSAGIETQRAWEGTTQATYDIEFQLLNTVNTSQSNILKNRALVNRLINSNLAWRINSLAAVPPVLYEIDIPNIRHSPVAIVQNLAVTNLGHMDKEGIPDAYNVVLSIQELIIETRQIFAGATGRGSKVSAITPDLLPSEGLVQNRGDDFVGPLNPNEFMNKNTNAIKDL